MIIMIIITNPMERLLVVTLHTEDRVTLNGKYEIYMSPILQC